MNWYKKSQNQIRLWLDDVRDPSNPLMQKSFGAKGDEIWVRTPQEAIRYLKSGNVSFISLDYDLGYDLDEKELKGLEVAKWIEEAAFEKRMPRIEWRVHSQNPVGHQAIVATMKSAERFWDEQDEQVKKVNSFNLKQHKLSQDYQIYSIQDAIQSREDIVPSLLRKPKRIKKRRKLKVAGRIIRITEFDYNKIVLLVEKMIRGQRTWAAEELQLQDNYPEIVEKLLREKHRTNPAFTSSVAYNWYKKGVKLAAINAINIMYHVTSRDRTPSIQKDGLKINQEWYMSQGSRDVIESIYKVRPIFLSLDPNLEKYNGANNVTLQIDTRGLDLVADIPSLYDTGGYYDENIGMWWEGDTTPEILKPYLDEEEMIYFDDLLDPNNGIVDDCISLTKTAACLSNIEPSRIRVLR